MLVNLQECPVCQGRSFQTYKTCKDFTVSGETFTIVNCDQCGFKFTNPRPDDTQIMRYYESPQYISHKNKSNNLINFVYKNVRKFTVRQKATLVGRLANKGKMLDYGCGTGEFLKACKLQDWNISGIEPAATAREQAMQLTQTTIYGSVFDIHIKQKYDAITMWHVLEHIHELNETMRILKNLLNPGGKIIIAVPNYTSYDAQLYDSFWAGYDLPRHLYHFDQDTISNFLGNHGFKIEVIIPMKLDAYYVSLLSEKNKTNRSDMFKAIFNGYLSNKKAKKKQLNYSSLIYVAGYD